MATVLERIEKRIEELISEKAKREAALNNKLADLKTKSATAGAAAEAAFNATNLDRYYKKLSERREADDEYRMIERQRDNMRKAPGLPREEYEALIKEIVDFDSVEREKAERSAAKLIEEISCIAEKSIARSDEARRLIDMLQYEVFECPQDQDEVPAIRNYVGDRSKAIKSEALAQLRTYLTDRTYIPSAYIYNKYANKNGDS